MIPVWIAYLPVEIRVLALCKYNKY